MLRKTAGRSVEGLWNTNSHIIGTFTCAECTNHFAAPGYGAD